jgi:trk system potassium uptake protein TrkH
MLPISNTNGQYLGFVDAFFMSVSATCVTGLGVVHLGNDFTIFGQVVILFLIQIGGLGYMTMTTILIYLAGKRLSISDSKIFSTSTGSDSQLDVKDFIIKIGIVTLLIEGLGAILIFKDSFDIVSNKHSYQSSIVTFLHSLFEAIFHSVSAYCNAGLSLYESCLETHSTNYYLLTVLSGLIILGGLGYTVLTELFNWLIGKKKSS